MNYDPIEELNNENERRLWRALLHPVIVAFVSIFGSILVYLFSSEIERFTTSNSLVVGWTLVIGGMVTVVWMKLREW